MTRIASVVLLVAVAMLVPERAVVGSPPAAQTFQVGSDGILVGGASGLAAGDQLRVTVTTQDGGLLWLTSSADLSEITGALLPTTSDAAQREIGFSGTRAKVTEALRDNLRFRATSSGEFTVVIVASEADLVAFTMDGVSRYYRVSSSNQTWSAARDSAAAAEIKLLDGSKAYGYLATITSKEENDFIKQYVSTTSWIGASDDFNFVNTALGSAVYEDQLAAEGKWYWVTGPEKGTRFSFGNDSPAPVEGRYNAWASGEPNNSGSNEHCGEFYTDGLWNDIPCTQSKPAIIEFGPFGADQDIASEVVLSVTSFTVPTVSTASASSVGGDSATLGGTVVSDGLDPVTARGVVYGTSATPTLGDGSSTSVLAGDGTGAFTATVTGLTPGTTYTVRAFATNTAGTAYGTATTFTTLAVPTLGPTGVSGITMTGAALASDVLTSATDVTARGFVWATSGVPVLGGAGVTAVTAGTGTGAMTATLTDLTLGTTYTVRAYATNAAGTAYGPTQTFATAANAITTTDAALRWYSGPTPVDPGVTVTGADLTGATVSIADNRPGDLLGCPSPAVTGITCTSDAATGVLTLSGTATAADYQTALRGITFTATNVGTDTTSRSITFNLGGSLTFDPATGHYYEVVTVSSAGAAYAGGEQNPNGTLGDLASGANISWEEARCRAKYTNARFGGTLMTGSARVDNRTTQAADGCVAITEGEALVDRSLNGQLGHLANITSLEEHQFLRTKLTGTGWIGGSDVDTEGTWIWMDGPEAGQIFWIEGTTTNRREMNTIGGVNRFNYWSEGEPNDASGEHWAEFGFGSNGVGSSWNDCRNGCNRTRYVVEYSATGGVVPPVLSATRHVTPLPAQVITFDAASQLVYGDAALALTASTNAAGRTVVLSVTTGDGTACSLDGATLSWVGPGTCVVTATEIGEDVDAGVQPAPPVARTITMVRRPLPIAGLTATPRAYDGTTTVAITGTPTFDPTDLLPADVGAVTLSGAATGTLGSAAAGIGRSVTMSGLVLGGARGFAYEPTVALTVDIARREVGLAGSFTVADRAYDGSTVVTASSTSLTFRAGDVLAGDVGNLGFTAVTFAADAAGAGTRTAAPVTATLTGARANDYRLELAGAPTATFTITAITLTVASGSFTVADKVYDGTDTATIVTDDLVLTGLLAGDSVTDVTWAPAGRFTVRDVGSARAVELLGGAVLGGPKGGGYVLDVSGAPTATAAITPRTVTVTGATAATRPYDGTTAVIVSGATLANAVAGDAVTLANATSGVAASRDAGTRSVSTSMSLTGAASANYRLAGQPALSVTITPLPVSVTMNALPARPYDGTTAVPLGAGAFTVSGLLSGEAIAVSGTGQLSSRAAGTRIVTLAGPTFTPASGTTLTNYTLPASVSGTMTITPLALRVVDAAVATRTWDGTTSATVNGARLDGVRTGDDVSLSGATTGVFASAQPGTHAVRFAPTLIGADAINYTLTVPTLTGTISRAPATLRITGGLVQFADGSARSVRAAVSPASAGRVVISYGGGPAPSAPGTYTVTVTLDSATHTAEAVSATLVIDTVEALLIPTTTSSAAPGTSGTQESPVVDEARRAAVLARVAVRTDGTLALPEIGPVLEADGTAPAFAPRDHRVLDDGEPTSARVTVVEEQRVRIETDDRSLTLELQASIGGADGRVPLPVTADGTLLLDRDGLVEVAGSGFLPGSTAEVWMFSTATFLGTAIVGPDGSFDGAFPIDETLGAGDHTLQLNAIGADERVRSTSLGVRIDDPADPSRDRVVVTAAKDGGAPGVATGPLGLLVLAALVGAAAMRWWLVGRRRRDEEEQAGAVEQEWSLEPH